APGAPAPARTASEFEDVLRTRADHDGLRYLAERMLDADGGLILLIDQFEELYSLCDDPQERAAFIGNLLHAAGDGRGRVSIVLTLRSDFLGALNQHPELARLIAAQNVVVPVMGEDELRRAIEEPARRAGREIDPGTVQLLLEQTRGREGALPLLEFVLARIWDGLTRGVAAASTVQELGGVGGALARQAQAVYDGLDAGEREIARRAFLAMVRLGEGTRDTRRRAPLAEMVTAERSEDQVLAVLRRFSEPGCRLISLSGAAAATTAEVAHEALFDHWQLLRGWLDESREDLRFQRRLADAARQWDQMGRPDGSLWRPPELDLLREFRARAAGDMTPLEVAFDRASERQDGRARWLRRGAIAAAIGALLAVAGGLSVYSRQQAEFAQRQAELRATADLASAEAIRQARLAESEKQRADAQRDQAIGTQSRFLAGLSEQQTERGNATNGILLALEALPENMAEPDRPYAVEAEAALYQGVLEQRELAVLGDHGDAMVSAALSPDGARLVTTSGSHAARLWDVTSGKELATLSDPAAAILAAAFSPDGARITTVSDDGRARLWEAGTGAPLGALEGDWGRLRAAAFDPDGARVATVSSDGRAGLRDAASGALLAVLPGDGQEVVSAAFSPDVARAVTLARDGTARLWDVSTGQPLGPLEGRPLGTLLGHGGEVNSAAFSPDGARVVTASRDGTARLWDAASGRELMVLQGHKDLLVRVGPGAFSPDGTRVVTASDDRTARMWDVASGQELAVLQGHDLSLRFAAFGPDGTKVVSTAEDGTVRLWRAAGSPLVAMLVGHQDSIRRPASIPAAG
ncbi:MAG: WD40 repeat domain-containing protein, partial [Geminicoccaceae bacterium]